MLLHLFKLFLAWTLNLKANSAIWHIRIAMRSSTLTAIVSQVWIFFLLWRRRTHCYPRYLPSLQRWKGRQVLSDLGEQQRGWVFTVPRRLSAFWCTIDILRRRRYGVQFSFAHIPLSELWADRDGTIDMVFPTCSRVSSSTGLGTDCYINIAYNQQLKLCSSSTDSGLKKGVRTCRPHDDLCTADPSFKFNLSDHPDNDVSNIPFLIHCPNLTQPHVPVILPLPSVIPLSFLFPHCA